MSQMAVVTMTLDEVFAALHKADREWLQAQLSENGMLDFEVQLTRAANEEQQLEKLASLYSDSSQWLAMIAPNQPAPVALKEAIREELLNMAQSGDQHG